MWRLHHFCIKFKTDILDRLKNINFKNKKIDSSKPKQEKPIINKATNMPLNKILATLMNSFFANKTSIFSIPTPSITYNFN